MCFSVQNVTVRKSVRPVVPDKEKAGADANGLDAGAWFKNTFDELLREVSNDDVALAATKARDDSIALTKASARAAEGVEALEEACKKARFLRDQAKAATDKVQRLADVLRTLKAEEKEAAAIAAASHAAAFQPIFQKLALQQVRTKRAADAKRQKREQKHNKHSGEAQPCADHREADGQSGGQPGHMQAAQPVAACTYEQTEAELPAGSKVSNDVEPKQEVSRKRTSQHIERPVKATRTSVEQR